MSDDPAELWRAALEEHVRGMSDSEFQQLVARTRPPDYTKFTDPAQRMRAVTSGIAVKHAQRPKVDHNGYALPTEGNTPDPAALAAIDDQIQAAEKSGNHLQAIALKRQKHQLRKGTPK